MTNERITFQFIHHIFKWIKSPTLDIIEQLRSKERRQSQDTTNYDGTWNHISLELSRSPNITFTIIYIRSADLSANDPDLHIRCLNSYET